MYHSADSNSNENDQIFNPCNNCRQRKGYLNTYDLPSVSAGPDIIICTDETAQLHASGADNYSWSPSLYLSDDDIADPISSTPVTQVYEVEGSETHSFNPFGSPSSYSRTCFASDEMTVDIDFGPILSLPEEIQICDLNQLPLTLNAGGSSTDSFQWRWENPGESFGIFLGTDQSQATLGSTGMNAFGGPLGTYSVRATSENGCGAYDETEIVLLDAIFSYSVSYNAVTNEVTFSFTDVPAAGSTHFWGVAVGAISEGECTRVGDFLDYEVSSSSIFNSISVPFGTGDFYLFHGESSAGCYYPVLESYCIHLDNYKGGIIISNQKSNSGGSSSELASTNVEVNVFPNPAISEINLQFNNLELGENQRANISVINIQGVVLKRSNVILNTSLHKVDVSGLAKGLYLISIEYANQNIVKKVQILD